MQPKREHSPPSASKKKRAGPPPGQSSERPPLALEPALTSVTGTVYSQPQDTGIGRHWKTQLVTALHFLKVRRRELELVQRAARGGRTTR